jgi:hypothetical protein
LNFFDIAVQNQVSLSICCFRYFPAELRERPCNDPAINDLNREIIKRLHAEHRHYPSRTEVGTAFAIRPCYTNPRTGRCR